MGLQEMVDAMLAANRRERSASQLTLGQLISKLEDLPGNSPVPNLTNPKSYRGYYADLAFDLEDGTCPAAYLLDLCRAALGTSFVGYKGGDFEMGRSTPLWVAGYGDVGQKIIDFDGEDLSLQDDD